MKNVEDIYPLSPMQQGMLFHLLHTPESQMYFGQISFGIRGQLDASMLRRAWQLVIDRHSALRTIFLWEGLDEPLQVVRQRVDLDWQDHDWRGIAEGEQPDRLESFLRADRERPINLTKATLLRLALIRLADESYQFVWSGPQLQWDGWSRDLALKEAFTFYQAFCRGEDVRLEQPPRYREYISWLQQQDMTQAELFWRRALKDFTSPTPLGFARAPNIQSGLTDYASVVEEQDFVQHSIQLPAKTMAALHSLARQHRLTLNTFMQSVWAFLLSRYSGEEDIVFGAVVSGRPAALPGVESMLGLFVNTLPVRIQVHLGDLIIPWLKKLHAQQFELQAYEYSPLIQIQKWSEVSRGLPLFESILVFENYPTDASSQTRLGDLEIVNTSFFDRTNYPLTVMVLPGPEWSLLFLYDCRRFDHEAINRILGHFKMLLESIALDPNRRLADLPLLTAADQQQILVEWNNTAQGCDLSQCLHQVFEAQAEQTPEAVALVCNDECLTYCELNHRANGLARQLVARGVGPDDLVGVLAERGISFIIALLAIFKAGGAYLPLDPHHPPKRLAQVLIQSASPLVLASNVFRPVLLEALADMLPGTRPKILDVEDFFLSPLTVANLPARCLPGHLAYVMFTSGSTGAPKGVMVEHVGMRNHIFAKTQDLGLTDGDIIAQTGPQGFDIFMWQCLATLLIGGQVHIFGEDCASDPSQLLKQVERCNITIVQLVPSMLRALTQEAKAQGVQRPTLHALRWMVPTGEALPTELCREWLSLYPYIPLLNTYGSTECSDDQCHYVIDQAPPLDDPLPIASIGGPIANMRAYVLDSMLAPTPVGVAGELHIGGIGVGRGYLGDPQRTAQAFIPDAFSSTPGSRLYRTRDQVRYLPEGRLEFIGRSDHLVKIHGFRIEPGEIEAVLKQHAIVRDAVVLAREDTPGNKRLVAYIVWTLNPLNQDLIEELRQFVQARLPDYMVPSAFVQIQAMPLTANGKIDRQALPATEQASPERLSDFVAPRTPIEETLAGIWARVFGLERVSVHDDFFALGGDSILSIQLIARAREAGLRFTPHHIFKYHTIARLAAVIDLPRLPQAERKQDTGTGSVPLTPIQQWFFEQGRLDLHCWTQVVLLEVYEAWDGGVMMQAVRVLLAHHAALRMQFVPGETGWQASLVEPTSYVPFTCVDLSGLSVAGQTLALKAAVGELETCLNLAVGALIHMAWFKLGQDKSGRLALMAHRLVVDQSSWRILLEDLQLICRQIYRKERTSLPAGSSSYKKWAECLGERAREASLKSELSYWVERLYAHVMPLPSDYAASAVPHRQAVAYTLTQVLGVEETRSLLQQVPAAYRTQTDEVLLTALAQVLSHWTAASAVVISLEGHAREAYGQDVSRMVGQLASVFPVVLEVNAHAPAGEVLKSVKEQLRQIPNRGVGYGLLRYLSADAEITRPLCELPQAEVSFHYLGQFDQILPQDTAFRIAREHGFSAYGGLGAGCYGLTLEAMVLEGQLRLDWTYDATIHSRTTIEKLAQAFLETLQALMAHCLSPEAGGYTPSDFPLANLDQSHLDQLVGKDRSIEDIYPLSPTQAGMLFHTLYSPGSGMYFEHLVCTLRGEMDSLAFQQAWQHVIDRHPILRTSFVWDGLETPLQIVRRGARVPCEQHDWRGDRSGEHALRLASFLQADRQREFELAQAPLMRLILIRYDEFSYYFVWSFHHLIMDGWSMALALREVLTWYEALTEGGSAELEVCRPYQDYITWLQNQDVQKSEAFWRQSLAGFSAPTQVGIERANIPLGVTGDNDAREIVHISETSTMALQQVARKHQLTLSTLVQGAWALLLNRYSQAEDLVFGVTMSGRSTNLPGSDAMVGLFINTLPIRVRLSPDAHLLAWLEAFQAAQVELRQYEYSSLLQIQGWSDAPRGQSLFDSIVVFENYPVTEITSVKSGQLEVQGVEYWSRTNYPLTLYIMPGKTIELMMSYDSRCFEPGAIARMLGHMQNLLEAMIARLDRPVYDLPLLTAAEQRQVLVEWNTTQLDDFPLCCIHEIFQIQASRSPDATAVCCQRSALDAGFQSMTYQVLDERSNRLAHYLRALGVGPDARVGICLERSLEMLVSLLGILKAGGAYVPLDPSYPQDRLAFMIHDAQLGVLLTQTHLLPHLPACPGQIVCFDRDWPDIAHHPSNPVDSGVLLDHLTYVIYTSGSTGQPKGVQIPHRALANILASIQQQIGFASADILLATTTLSFDIAGLELYLPWMSGAMLVIADQEVVSDGIRLSHLLNVCNATVMQATPVTWQMLLESGWKPQQPFNLLCGGEALPVGLARQLLDYKVDMWNLYGPTETTIWSTTASLALADRTISIGRPIANTQVYLLDAYFRSLPVGVAGELYIGGSGLARGYLNRPDLTADKFIPNPFSPEAGARLYRTGDWARYLPDGRIEYVGRQDDQVKVRGFRIELGEIETALSQHPAVHQCVAIVREDIPAEKRLVAYVIPDRSQTVTTSDLRLFLTERLPGYMLPSAFVNLDSFPLTPNGKINRRALPPPDTDRPDLGLTYVAPQNAMEQSVAAIWQDLLHIDKVGVHDNFFDLGGHSLLMVRAQSSLRQMLDREVPLVDLFRYSTIRSLAAYLTQERNERSSFQKGSDRAAKRRELMKQRQNFPSTERS